MMRAKSAKVTVWNAKDIDASPTCIGLAGSPTQVVKIFTPAPRQGGQVFQGESDEVAEKVVTLLKPDILG
jgi:electron transfer flavoprotein beta subunit